MFFSARRRAVAWLTVGLAGLVSALPSVAGPDAPAAGSYRVLSGVVRLAGADGSLWLLGVSASTSDQAVVEDHSVYASLSHCPGFYAMCSHVGAWRIAVGASAVQVAPDLSTASLKTTIGGFPIAMTLRSTGPTDPTLPAYPDVAVRDGDATPSAVVRLTKENRARGTVTFAGASCPVTWAFIGEDTGVDTIGHDDRINMNLIRLVGADRVTLGSDYCFDMGLEQPVHTVERLTEVSDTDRDLILGKTAARLLHIG